MQRSAKVVDGTDITHRYKKLPHDVYSSHRNRNSQSQSENVYKKRKASTSKCGIYLWQGVTSCPYQFVFSFHCPNVDPLNDYIAGIP